MKGLYLDSSAFVKTISSERESRAVRRFLKGRRDQRVSSALLRAEVLRAVRHLGPDALSHTRSGLRRVNLIAIDDRILETAGILEPRVIRTLDAIHLATAITLGEDLSAVVTYDDRMIEGARLLGLPVATPR